ncbi:MAG: ribonuclease III [Flavobacteriales bacterium]
MLARHLSPHKALFISIKNLLGFYPRNINLYLLAFRHKSVATEIKDGVKNSNERLEFLGDALLGSIVAEYLFSRFPYKDEGFLTEMRSKIVSRTYLNNLALKMGIDKLVQYNQNAKVYKSIYGDTLEALIGAIYLDKGFHFTRKLLLERIIKFYVDVEELELQEFNFKSKLINWAQKQKKSIFFDAKEQVAADKQRYYEVTVLVDDQPMGQAKGLSKKAAEQSAAESACAAIFRSDD